MRTLLLTVVAASALAWTGFPVSQEVNTRIALFRSADLAAAVRAVRTAPVPPLAERWRESGSLVLLAAALFAASVAVNRRR